MIDPRPKAGAPGWHVARNAAGMFGLKIAYSLVAFSLGILLARALEPAGYGSYTYATSWAVFLGVPAALGLDKFLVRQVAVTRDRQDWPHFRGLMATAYRAGLTSSFLFGGVAAVIAALAWRAGHRDAASAVLVGLLLVPILTLMKIRQAALTGLGQVVRGQWPEMLVQPILLLSLLLGWWVISGHTATAVTALAITVFCSAVVLILGAWLLHKSTPPAAVQARAEPVSLPWRESLLPLIAMGTIQMLQSQSDTLLLGMLADTRAVGLYGVASRGAQLILFFLMAAVPALGPTVASLHAAGDRASLERVVVKTARTTFLLSLPVGLGLIVLGRWYLLLFGPEFAQGATVLALLSAGQLVNVACGPVGIVMIMTGQETAAARLISIAAVTNVVLSGALIPLWGITGAAIGSTASTILWNVLLVFAVRRTVGIRSTAFSRIRS